MLSPRFFSHALAVIIVFVVLWGTLFVIMLPFRGASKKTALFAAMIAFSACLYDFWQALSR